MPTSKKHIYCKAQLQKLSKPIAPGNAVAYLKTYTMQFQYNDGGRAAAGYKGDAGDCVCRSICIVTGLPYQQVYETLANGTVSQRKSKLTGKKAKSAARGINCGRKWFKDYMKALGFTWVPTMAIGTGCKVHLTDGELPMGRLVVAVSKHYTAVIDGVIHDTYSPERNEVWTKGDGTSYVNRRCVYGYYIFKP